MTKSFNTHLNNFYLHRRTKTNFIFHCVFFVSFFSCFFIAWKSSLVSLTAIRLSCIFSIIIFIFRLRSPLVTPKSTQIKYVFCFVSPNNKQKREIIIKKNKNVKTTHLSFKFKLNLFQIMKFNKTF